MGNGPYYTLVKDYHLVYFEIPKTIRRILNGGPILLDNGSNPSISVATIAKKKLNPGDKISKGIGSFSVRGEAIRIKDMPNHLPIGLCNNVTIKKKVEEGQILTFDDVELESNRAIEIWYKILEKVQQR
jgi:predicted homoserine dehydrogenase-like protein